MTSIMCADLAVVMPNPILIQLTRGRDVESSHRGALCVADASGEIVVSLGNVDAPIYPRSAIKVLQALPLVETRAAEKAGFANGELALACASHNGEGIHVDTARVMLSKCGLTPDALACGSHWPLDATAARALAAGGGTPCALHNNCSGKHAGMLALAVHLGVDVEGYQHSDHPVQQCIRCAIEEMTGEALSPQACAIDGCSVPTWAMALGPLAAAFARLTSSSGLSSERAAAAKRLLHACTSEPFMVEGTGRFGTGVMQKLGAAAFVKGGAEGVYCAAFPERGLGLALKIEDGARRGAEAVAATIIAGLFSDRIESAGDLYDMTLTNWNGRAIGEILPSRELAETVAQLNP